MNINQKVTRFALCLGAFVAIRSGLFGLGLNRRKFYLNAKPSVLNLVLVNASRLHDQNDFLLILLQNSDVCERVTVN